MNCPLQLDDKHSCVNYSSPGSALVIDILKHLLINQLYTDLLIAKSAECRCSRHKCSDGAVVFKPKYLLSRPDSNTSRFAC